VIVRKNIHVEKELPFSYLGNELEVTGNVRNLSPTLWTLSQLTVLYLNDNQLSRLPSEIACLANLVTLDLSNNKLRNLPSEIGIF
jgi:CCR4-NOT transcription complex subunit 6